MIRIYRMNKADNRRGYMIMLYALIAIAVLFLGLCVFLASFLTNGRRQTFEESMKWQKERYDTSFYTSALSGDYLVEGDGGYRLNVQLLRTWKNDGRYVIITHGITDNRFGALKYARFYLDLGFNCVIYDLRGHGANEKTYTTYGDKEGRDLAKIVEDTRKRYPDLKTLGIHGESLGAATTIMCLKYRPEVDFAVADCGYSDIENVLRKGVRYMKLPGFLVDMQNIGLMIRYRCSFKDMRPIDALADSTVPVMFIHGEDDELITPSNSQDMFDAAKGYKEIHFVKGAAHAVSAVVAPEEYQQLLESFTERVLTEKELM